MVRGEAFEKHEGSSNNPSSRLDLNLLVIVVGFLLLAIILANPQQSLQNKLDVTGSASMQVPSDQLTIQFSIQTESASASDAQKQNSMITSEVLNSLHSLGISNESISTVSYYLYINPYYDKDGVLVNKTYVAVHSIKVELKDDQMQKGGDVIDTVINSGANRIDSISFGLKEETEKSLKTKLLSQATENAKQKADALASASGARIVGIYQISESSVSVYPVRYPVFDYAGAEKTTLIPGDVSTSASVSVSYKIA